MSDADGLVHLQLADVAGALRARRISLPEGIHIRAADPGADLTRIAELYNAVFEPDSPGKVTTDEVSHFVQHPSLDPGGVFLAFDGELVVGLGVGSVPIPKSDSSARVGAIELLAVRASHRRQGIGRALIQRVLCWLASQDVTTVSVSAEHPVLLATLKRYGFGPLPTPIPPGNQLLGGQ